MTRIEVGPVVVEQDQVREYLSATGSRAAVYRDLERVPAPAVAALMLREFLRTQALPAGVLQTAQHLTVHRPARVGEPLSCVADISDGGGVGTRTLLVLRFAVRDSGGRDVVVGQTHLLVPGDVA